MFELMVLLGVFFVAACFLIGCLKFLVLLVLLPIKLAIGLAKGIVGLVFFLPLLCLGGFVFAGVFPVLLLVLLIPVLLVALCIGALVRLAF